MDSDASDKSDGNLSDDEFLQQIEEPLQGEVNLDEFMASAAHAKPRRNTTAAHLKARYGVSTSIQREKR
jgi:hypothetical protein